MTRSCSLLPRVDCPNPGRTAKCCFFLPRSPHASHRFVFKNRAQERQLHEPDYGGLRFETVSSTVLPTATMVLGCGVWFEIQDFLVVVWWNAGVRSAATISPVARLAGSP